MSQKSEIAKPANIWDGLKWLVVALIVGLGVFGNYYYSSESLLYRVLILLVLGLFAVFVAFRTVKGQAFWGLLRDARAEIYKVVWPTRQETVQATLIVVVVVVVMSLILWGIDSLLGWIVSYFIGGA